MRSPADSGDLRSRTLILVVTALILIAGACGKEDPVEPPDDNTPNTVTVSFSDQIANTQFTVGNSIVSNGVPIIVEQFQWSNGVWTSEGTARIEDDNYAGGEGLEIYPNNCNLNFQFDYPGTKITLKVGGSGGNENIRVNGTFQNVLDLATLNGTTIAGVQITIPPGDPTFMTLEGDITGFAIGGQETWFDDIVFTPADN